MARQISYTRPIKSTDSRNWPAIRIVFPGESQVVYFALLEYARRHGITQTDYARRVLVDWAFRAGESGREDKMFGDILFAGQVEIPLSTEKAKKPRISAAYRPKAPVKKRKKSAMKSPKRRAQNSTK